MSRSSALCFGFRILRKSQSRSVRGAEKLGAFFQTLHVVFDQRVPQIMWIEGRKRRKKRHSESVGADQIIGDESDEKDDAERTDASRHD